MSTNLTIHNASLRLQWEFSKANPWGSTVNAASFGHTLRLVNGTAAGQADRLYVHEGTIATSSNVDLDLAGSLTDLFGGTITFARIKMIYVELTTETEVPFILVGGATANAFANWITSAGTITTDVPAVRVRNGGAFMLSCSDATGYVVTAGTGDILRLQNTDATHSAKYRIALVGASA